jgi:hypothetical protein
MQTHEGVNVLLCASLTSTLDGVEWSGFRAGRFTPCKDSSPGIFLQEARWTPRVKLKES